MPASKIIKWEFKDRPENELGDIQALADDFVKSGQQQPCVVRPIEGRDVYELIIGERRWRAAQLANIDLKVIIRNLSDSDAALIQSTENSHREGLSDYARGVNYTKLIEKGILTQRDLVERLNLSKQQVSRLLSFSKIPQEIIFSIGDMSKVSARTAETIKQLSSRGPEYVEAIKTLADKLRQGKVGHNKLSQVVEKKIYIQEGHSERIYDERGQHIFTLKLSRNPSIHFPARFHSYFKSSENAKLLVSEIKKLIRKNNESPRGDF